MLLARPQATPAQGAVVDVPEHPVPELVHAALDGSRRATPADIQAAAAAYEADCPCS